MYTDEQLLKLEAEEFRHSNPERYKYIYNQALEKMQKWCIEQSRILKKESEDFNDEECFGGYRAFEDMIRYIDTIKQEF